MSFCVNFRNKIKQNLSLLASIYNEVEDSNRNRKVVAWLQLTRDCGVPEKDFLLLLLWLYEYIAVTLGVKNWAGVIGGVVYTELRIFITRNQIRYLTSPGKRSIGNKVSSSVEQHVNSIRHDREPGGNRVGDDDDAYESPLRAAAAAAADDDDGPQNNQDDDVSWCVVVCVGLIC